MEVRGTVGRHPGHAAGITKAPVPRDARLRSTAAFVDLVRRQLRRDYREEDLLGMSIGDVFEEEEQEQANAFMGTWLEALIRVGALSKIEARFIARDERRVPILFSRTAVKDSDGNITHIICIAKDMTGYIRQEQPEKDTVAGNAPDRPHAAQEST